MPRGLDLHQYRRCSVSCFSTVVASNLIKVVGSREGWVGATVSDPVTLYGLNEEIRAYGFNVLLKNSIVGYIIVNTGANDAPVPEFGVGGGLPFLSVMNQVPQAAMSQLKAGETFGKQKIVYLSALEYVTELPIYQGQHNKGSLYVDTRNGKVYHRSDLV